MSRRKVTPAVAEVTTKKRAKANNLHARPEHIPLGTVLTDSQHAQWKVGPSIGSGGFGEIYCAYNFSDTAPKTHSDYPNVVKIEPHDNGPLFVEKNFYMKNCRLEAIERFRKVRKLKHLGMPHFIASGTHLLNNVKHRFLVIPRYGASLQSLYLRHNKCLPIQTVYRAARQMLDVLEYIHSCEYVHADLKGDNILFGMGDRGQEKLFLVDFGMTNRIVTDKQFKPDPKKKHNGTIEYTSRDAHQGVMTMRGDFEILAYNIIEWAGGNLPWKEDKILKDCNKVQQMKEEAMGDIANFLKKCFRNHLPAPKPLQEYLQRLCELRFNETPNYAAFSKIFERGLKTLGASSSGALDETFAKEVQAEQSSGPMNKTKYTKRKALESPERSSALPDTVPNTELDDSFRHQIMTRTRRSQQTMDSEDAYQAGPSKVNVSKRGSSKVQITDGSHVDTLNDTVPNTPPEKERSKASVISRKKVNEPESKDRQTAGPSRGRTNRATKKEENELSPEIVTTVSQSQTQPGVFNIRIDTPTKKVRGGTPTPQQFTFNFTINSNVTVHSAKTDGVTVTHQRNSVLTQASASRGSVAIATESATVSTRRSIFNESLNESDDVIEVSSTTDDGNVSRSLFD
ncbi:AGAP001933-PA-like protein [Anopheles sinensis]|uniref:non-specific serine/threonine protein kinase n=1 Tax=Anopheles sinensis TaxID=74873 RepID=A0A084VS22_ANOSI|nr:AGAP001933-PA-like protein [Anopheles sinensis]